MPRWALLPDWLPVPVIGLLANKRQAWLAVLHLTQEQQHIMQQIVIDVPAGQLSAELERRGVAADAKVHVVVEFLDDGKLPMTVISEAGRAQDWLANEPDLYDDSDLVERAS